MAEDFYTVLGVGRDADANAIKKAYRALALANHPDKNPGNAEAEARFRAASQAYEVLGDSEKRGLYDRYGEAGVSGHSRDMHHVDLAEIFGSFSDIFEGMFGGFGGGGPRRGADIRIRIPVTWEQVISGASRNVKIPRHTACDGCAGCGSLSGAGPSVCGGCGGSGQRAARQGFFVMSSPCPICAGRGGVIADPCGDCGGVGLRREEATVAIEIPAGVDHGMQLRMHGEGDLGDLQLPRGDLLLLFQTQDPPDGWERDGNDLHRLLPLQLVDAVLGRKMTIPGIGDELQVSVPAGSRDGDTITIRGAGLPDVNGGRRGRIILHAALEVPRKLNRKQRKIWEQLRDG